jgi:hypothetical protein
MKILLLSFTNALLFRAVVGGFQSLPFDSYTLKKEGNCNLLWILTGEDGGTVSRLTRSGNCGLRPRECNADLQMKRNLDFRGFEPQLPSSPLFPLNRWDVVESAAFLVSAVSQSLATVLYILRTSILRRSRL